MNFQLGIPFPLFNAPIEDADQYASVATCCVCKAENVHGFPVALILGLTLLSGCVGLTGGGISGRKPGPAVVDKRFCKGSGVGCARSAPNAVRPPIAS